MTEWIDRVKRQFGTHLAPRPATRIGTCESRLRFKLPEDYKAFLRQHDGGVIFLGAGQAPENGGLHLFGCDEMIEETHMYRQFSQLSGMIIFASTPGAGAYYLALDSEGQVVDTAFGERKVIAESVTALVERMFATMQSEPDPFFWFR